MIYSALLSVSWFRGQDPSSKLLKSTILYSVRSVVTRLAAAYKQGILQYHTLQQYMMLPCLLAPTLAKCPHRLVN